MTRVLKYVERSTGSSHNGEAWIGYVETSKSGRTIYFNGRAFGRSIRGGFANNHHDVETYEAYWISGVKKRGTNRHWAGSGKIQIESTAVPEYLELTGAAELDLHEFEIVDPLPLTDKERIRMVLNESIYDEVDAV